MRKLSFAEVQIVAGGEGTATPTPAPAPAPVVAITINAGTMMSTVNTTQNCSSVSVLWGLYSSVSCPTTP